MQTSIRWALTADAMAEAHYRKLTTHVDDHRCAGNGWDTDCPTRIGLEAAWTQAESIARNAAALAN